MSKNNKPFSEPCDLRIAFVGWFEWLAALPQGHVRSAFRSGKNWYPVPASGIISPDISSDTGPAGTVYKKSIKFRVAYDSPENRRLSDFLLSEPLIARYRTGGRQIKVIGSLLYPCKASVEYPEGLDGFECTLECETTEKSGFL